MPDSLRFRNYAAIAVLVVGKLLGIVGLVTGAASRVLGGSLLVLSGVFIAMAIALCIAVMRARAVEEDAQKKVLRQMMREGTLKQFMRDIEAEDATRVKNDGDHDRDRGAGPTRQTAFS